MYIKSKIYKSDVVKNSNRQFGSLEEYYGVWIEQEDGSMKFALFTPRELNGGIERAKKNPEDLTPPTPVIKRLFYWLKKLLQLK